MNMTTTRNLIFSEYIVLQSWPPAQKTYAEALAYARSIAPHGKTARVFVVVCDVEGRKGAAKPRQRSRRKARGMIHD